MSSSKSCSRKHCTSHSPKGLKSPIPANKHKPPKRTLPNITTCSLLNTRDLSLKLSLIQKLYLSKTLPQKQLLLSKWPNIEITQRITQCQLLELRPDVYFMGDVTNNLIHGYGLVIYNKQRFYEGYFQNNLKHGPGFQKLEFGVYVGNYINNKPEGKGLFIWNNNNLYEGDFVLGIKHGFGKYVTKKLTYMGQWKQNIPYGNGTIITKQSKYEGSVISGVKHGAGKEEFKNGDSYSGSFVNGKFEGVGKYCWFESGAVYKGMFKNGIRHGEGVWSNSVGDRYEGMYESNRKCGNGVLKYSNGNVYKGNFVNDLKHGYGEMIWSNGERYSGNWRFGQQDNKVRLLISKTNPIPQDKIKRCKTELNNNISSNISTKVKLPPSNKKHRLSQLKTEMTQQLTTSMMLRQHSRKFLTSNFQTLTCPNRRAPKILFNKNDSRSSNNFTSKEKLTVSQNARLIHDPNHNCSSRRICSVLDSPRKDSLERSRERRIEKIEVRWGKRGVENEEEN